MSLPEHFADIVPTAFGPVRGRLLTPSPVTPVRLYAGIPYAAPPVGELRWRPPQPPAPWTEPLQATAFGPDMPQPPGMGVLRGSRQHEDALHLHIWTPAGAAAGSLPVMVWIHGGGFLGGSASDPGSDGAMLAAQGVVVVSLNYRVGLFGFLAHPRLSAESAQRVSGNYGLLDQMAGLRWVRENIAAFGGDPARITAFGVSAGSASISLMLVSPLARGLFDQVALHSPGAARPLASLAQAEQAGLALGDDLGALRAMPAADLLSKVGLLSPAVRGLTTPRVLRPIRDGWLLPEDERPAFQAGRFQALPTLVGSNLDEGSTLTAGWPIRDIAAYRELVQQNFGDAANEALAMYPASSDGEVRARVADLFADTQFNYGTRLIARSMAAAGQPTWRYVFTRRAPGGVDGPHHSEEVPYVFGNLGDAGDAQGRELSRCMQQSWIDFARSGDPNGDGAPHWQAYQAAEDQHLDFGSHIGMGRGWRAAQLDFLERFFG